jgi:hypothetical protein
MKNMFLNALAAASLLAFAVVPVAHAQALDILNPPLQVQTKKKAVKHRTAGKKTTFSPGSQESTKERRARLMRECKGATNAGACSGYTR